MLLYVLLIGILYAAVPILCLRCKSSNGVYRSYKILYLFLLSAVGVGILRLQAAVIEGFGVALGISGWVSAGLMALSIPVLYVLVSKKMFEA